MALNQYRSYSFYKLCNRFILILLFTLAFIPLQAQTLLLFGGRNQNVFLGELNTSKYSTNSVWNEYGIYGSKYNTNSIWNNFGIYGGLYSSTSPFNMYAIDPPVVLDEDGNFYGYFTVNLYKAKRAEFELALIMYEYHEEIATNVSKWYGHIFK